MKKPIRLTESDLNRIVKNSVRRAIKESAMDEGIKDTLRDGALGVGLGAAAAAGVLGTDNHVSRFVKEAPPIRQEYDIRDTSDDDGMNRMAYFNDFRKNESIINRAITESIRRFINRKLR